MYTELQTFFRAEELRRVRGALRGDLYNRCRLLLQRSRRAVVFLPIRPMQVLAVITDEEIIFVDSEAYAVRGREGGRLILLAWQRVPGQPRESLDGPVPMDVVHYQPGQDDNQRRLIAELPKAADLLLKRLPDRRPPARVKVVPIGGAARAS